MTPDTYRLLQILRTTEALIKYYEGYPPAAVPIAELKECIHRTILDLGAMQAAENADRTGSSEFPATVDVTELD